MTPKDKIDLTFAILGVLANSYFLWLIYNWFQKSVTFKGVLFFLLFGGATIVELGIIWRVLG